MTRYYIEQFLSISLHTRKSNNRNAYSSVTSTCNKPRTPRSSQRPMGREVEQREIFPPVEHNSINSIHIGWVNVGCVCVCVEWSNIHLKIVKASHLHTNNGQRTSKNSYCQAGNLYKFFYFFFLVFFALVCWWIQVKYKLFFIKGKWRSDRRNAVRQSMCECAKFKAALRTGHGLFLSIYGFP